MSQISPILPTVISSGSKTLVMDRPLVMGILNLTPDSFFDGGQFNSPDAAIKKVDQMIREGAAVIDIGAVSTRPGAGIISPETEQERLRPVFKSIRKTFPDIWISLDTCYSSTAGIFLNEGADMINDISAGSMDPEMFRTAAEFQCPYVLMHMQGTPANMQQNPVYNDVTEEIISFFNDKITDLKKSGVKDIILDPGFGFGKSVEHNFEILKNLSNFKERCGFPVLAGISRKSMINKVIGTKPEEALNGTTALHMLALMNGASVIRVHDVKEAVQAVRLFEKYKSVND